MLPRALQRGAGSRAPQCTAPRPPSRRVGTSSSCRSSSRLVARAQQQAAPPSHAELLGAAEELVALARGDASQEVLDAKAAALIALSAAAGTNVLTPEHTGTFRGTTLTGRTAQRFRTIITLGTMSFNKYQPTDQKAVMADSEQAGSVFKGHYDGSNSAYVVTSPFELVEAKAVGDPAGDATPLGIKGRSIAVGEYCPAADNPARLGIEFKRMRMEPVVEQPGDLERWLELLLPHNPTMDAATGVLEVELPASPEGWLDHVLVLPEAQLLKGNYGSLTLLQRIAE